MSVIVVLIVSIKIWMLEERFKIVNLISGKLTLIHEKQGHGLVQMDNISESYHVQVAEEGVILLVQNVELKDLGLTVLNVMERYSLFLTIFLHWIKQSFCLVLLGGFKTW